MAIPRLRLMSLGRPKGGKTSLLAPALRAGFRVALMDWDGNPDPLYAFAPGCEDRLSVINLRDKLYARADGSFSSMGRSKDSRVEPQAFLRAQRAVDDWGKLDKEHPWGSVFDWGPDTILAFDSLTGCGDAAFNLALFLSNRDFGSVRRTEWFSAMRLEDQMIERLAGPEFKCHLYVTAHVKPIGPKTEDDSKDDDDDLVTAKHQIARQMAEVMPTRYFPTALGRALPQEILRRVPASVYVDSSDSGRVVWTQPPPGMPIDVGVPVSVKGKPLPAKLDYNDAFLTIMEGVCGYREPPKGEKA